jgi:nucleotide-binding universal stress UspA family protein
MPPSIEPPPAPPVGHKGPPRPPLVPTASEGGPSTLVIRAGGGDSGGMDGTRVVVGIDGSGASHTALRWAIGLGEMVGAEVVAVHAVGLLEDVHDPDAPAGSWRAGVASLVEDTWCAGLEQARCPHRVLVRDGPAADVLVGTAHDERAGLLVVGSRGVGRAEPALALGSTSLRVLQASRVPVLVAPESAAAPTGGVRLRRVLVGVDRSEPSLAALGLAADVAEATGAVLSVVEAFEFVSPFPLGPAAACMSRGGETARATIHTLLETDVRGIRDRGIATQVVVRSGDPAPTLLETAADIDADLVVVGTRGRGDPARPLLGSVARRVVHEVRRPTLVVPAAAGTVHLRRVGDDPVSQRVPTAGPVGAV